MRAEGTRYEHPPPVSTEKWSAGLPIELLLGLGELVADGKPIPPDWALAWVKWSPESRIRTPAKRCPDEFESLFATAYRNRYGDGLVLKPNRRKLAVTYDPASGGFSHASVQVETNVPDVTALTTPVNALNELAEQACTALDPYSRLLGRKPEAAGTAAALALLPHGLDGGGNGDADKVWAFAEQRLATANIAAVAATELIERWPGAHAAKLPKNEAVLLAQLLERRGFGMEPDPRFGGHPLAAGTSAVLFRRGQPIVSAPSAALTGAVSLLQLAGAVATADGKLAEPEEHMLRQHVIHGLHLGADEQARLAAHLVLVVAHPPTPAALRRRLASLGQADRAAAGHLLIAVAGADGQVTPEEINALIRLFNALGLDENDVYSQLHLMAAPSSRDALTTTAAARHARAALRRGCTEHISASTLRTRSRGRPGPRARASEAGGKRPRRSAAARDLQRRRCRTDPS
jgi:tellurite resistance protein